MRPIIREDFARDILALESDLHRNPEPSFHEERTTALLKDRLSALGYEILDFGLPTGVVARLSTERSGRTIALRADLDAIAQTEATGRPDASQRPGLMHACGHDVHTAALYGAALLFRAYSNQLNGDVILIFQPGEEVLEGSRSLMNAGLFDKVPVDCLFGLHNAPELPVGTVGITEGPLMAGKVDFSLKIIGKGGHGGMPHRCTDPIVAAAGIISALQTIISRNVDPMEQAVVSVCSIHGGTPENLIVDEVMLTGSIRALSPQILDTIINRLSAIVENGAATYGCKAELELAEKALPLINPGPISQIARRAGAAVFGEDRILPPWPVLASEDFSYYGTETPSFFYFLGSGRLGETNTPWHSPNFQAAPETSLWGARLYFESVLSAQRGDLPLR